MTPENLLTEWARLFVESLAGAGLERVVLSPGSRSTPLAWAVLECSRLRATSIVDERCAAFYAVGEAKVSGKPTAIVCTSGSAAANYFPAIVEAALSHTPLLVVTADRPFELADAGASQTIDQTKLYGAYSRSFVDLGMPDGSPGALAALRRRAAQAVAETTAPVPGVVHVNFRARKPLEPARAATPEGSDLATRVDDLLRTPYAIAGARGAAPPDAALDAIARDCASAERGLIVCGPASPAAERHSGALSRLARATGFPVYAEATSQHRFGTPLDVPPALVLDGLDALLAARSWGGAAGPEVVVQIGGSPVSAAFERWAASSPPARRHVVAPYGWHDPASSAATIVLADVEETITRLAAKLESKPGSDGPRRAWAEGVARANDAVWAAVDELVAIPAPLSEGSATRAAVAAMPPGSRLVLGNSLPVRHADTFCRAGCVSGVSVVSQRGTSGIDGVVSGAAGAAAADDRPTLLLVGDVSALHDIGGFALAAASRAPFVALVLNNDGGRIFERLPLHEAGLDEHRARFWTTPHGRTFDAAARFYGLAYEKPGDVDALSAAVRRALVRPGATLVEVTVPPHGAREQALALAARVDGALRGANRQ